MRKQKSNKSNLKVKIISGIWRGRNISFIEKKYLRPTKSQVRETLFNWLQNNIKNSVCLDLFSGSGALGFEAVSRGAKKVIMVDNDLEVINCLKEQKNIFQASNINIIHSDAEEFLADFQEEIDIIFIDPPFSQNSINNIILLLGKLKNIGRKYKVYFELPYSNDFEKNLNIPSYWKLLKSKRSGDVGYLLYQSYDTVI